MNEIVIIVEGGRVKEIKNLPEGVDVVIVDLDITDPFLGAIVMPDGRSAVVTTWTKKGLIPLLKERHAEAWKILAN